MRKLVWFLLAVGTLASLIAALQRWRVEATNRRVSVVLDGEQLLQASAEMRVPLPTLLRSLKQAGATGVALNEQSVEDLLRTGYLSWELYPKFPSPVMRAVSASVVERLYRGMDISAPGATIWRTVYTPSRKKLLDTLKSRPGVLVYAYTEGGGAIGFSAPMSPEAFLQMSVGVDPELARQVAAAGMEVLARPSNALMNTPQRIHYRLSLVKRVGAKIVIFSGDEVLGYRNLITHTAERMRQLGLVYGSVEFGKQKGDQHLTRLLLERTVRVHSVSASEMATLSPGELIDRYVRAVRERNIRVCYVRLPSGLSEDPLSGARVFLWQLRRELEEAGYALGQARPFTSPRVPGWIWAMVGGSAATASWLVLVRLFAGGSLERFGVLMFTLGAGVALLGGERGRQLCALAAAIAYPSLGFLVVDRLRAYGPPWRYALLAFVQMTLWSLVGGLHVAALLTSSVFMLKANQFVGVKVAHLLPVLIVGGAYGLGVLYLSHWRDWLQRVRHLWMQVWALPVTLGMAMVSVAVLVLLALLLLRTGNEPGIGVSAIEMRMRALLEDYLMVRPRTKEFLLGHPALIIALASAAAGGNRKLILVLLMMGAIGQASVVNTLCHIHTPLSLSLPRILIGSVLGAIIGLLAYGVARLAWRWWSR